MKNRTKTGFTLLEVIIVLGLLLVLISMLWSLVQVYSTYYISGAQRVERSQLVRSISQLLDEDLSAAIQDPIHPLAPSSEADDSVRRFGLLGTNTSLRVDVIQINPLDPTGKPTAKRRAAMGPVQDVTMQVPELKTIFYDFIPISPRQNQYFGLVRREISFETPDESGPQTLTEDDMESTDSAAVASVRSVGDWSADRGKLQLAPIDDSFDDVGAMPGVLDLPTPTVPNKETLGDRLSRENDPNRMWAPEVVEFSLRYSDGQNWHNSWDSIEKNGLPLAVEVKLTLMTLVDIDAVRKSPLFISRTLHSAPSAETTNSENDTVETTRTVGGGVGFVQAAPEMTGPTKPISWTQLTRELGIAPPKEQRIVVFLAGSPLLKNEPFRRPPSPAAAKPPSVSPPAASALTTGPPPTLVVPSVAPPPISSPSPAPSAPKPVIPSQQWIRK